MMSSVTVSRTPTKPMIWSLPSSGQASHASRGARPCGRTSGQTEGEEGGLARRGRACGCRVALARWQKRAGLAWCVWFRGWGGDSVVAMAAAAALDCLQRDCRVAPHVSEAGGRAGGRGERRGGGERERRGRYRKVLELHRRRELSREVPAGAVHAPAHERKHSNAGVLGGARVRVRVSGGASSIRRAGSGAPRGGGGVWLAGPSP